MKKYLNRDFIETALVMALPFIFLGAVIGIYPGFKAYQYVWNDARFCTTCHVHDYATIGWKNSIHGDQTTCHDCHHQRFRDYIKEAVVMVVHQPKFPEDLHRTPYVKKEICAACHISNAADRSTITGPMTLQDVEKIPKVDLSYLHKIHLSKTTDLSLQNSHALADNERILDLLKPTLKLDTTKGEERSITCADCHGGPANRGHNFKAVDSSCIRCHEKSHQQNQVAAQFGCRSCHFQGFLIPFNEQALHKDEQEKLIKKQVKDSQLEIK